MPSRPFRRFTRPAAVASLVLASLGASAGIVSLGPNPQPVAGCPAPGLPGLCRIDSAARADGAVSDYSAIRIGQGGSGSLSIGEFASVSLTRLDLAPGIPSSPNLIVGDNVNASGQLSVSDGGRLSITVPDAGNGSGGLLVGVFAAAPGSTGPTTTLQINDGGEVFVDKPGGWNVAAAVGIGFGAGSFSNLVMDGGIDGFGNQARTARLDTTGNLSIGRQGHGIVNVFRNAEVTANFVFMSTISTLGLSELGVGVGSKLTAGALYAGIGLAANGADVDPGNPNHGSAGISTQFGGVIAAPVVMGEGAVLMGTGTLGQQVVNHGGTIRPGNSPGTLHFADDLTDFGGRIEIEIGPGASDLLDIAGDLRLHGTDVVFRFIDGFAPTQGFSLDFAQVAGLIELDDVHFSVEGLRDGFRFDVGSGANGALSFTALTDGQPLPLPGTLALLLAAAAAALAASRRPAAHSGA